jgi:hypothetical protein
MWDLDQLLRGTTKYGTSLLDKSKESSEEEVDIAQKIRDEIREILNGYSLDLND